MNSEISRELKQHGSNWGKLHNGYFSDENIASPLVEQIKSVIVNSNPQAIADLGGGTGFILSQLLKNNIPSTISLFNIDASGKQLESLIDSRIKTICCALPDFKRNTIGDNSRIIFIMRSVFHYFGREELEPLLRHLRQQTKKGEFFIHQTACFESSEDADYANKLYEIMGTGKWYPTVKQIMDLLKNIGWSIESVCPASKLSLSRDDLVERYSLNSQTVFKIENELISKRISNTKNDNDSNWCYLCYKIFTCVAI